MDLRPGSALIEVIDGYATLCMALEESTDLINWTNIGQTPDMSIQAFQGKKFFRFCSLE
ncbi:MAG: hypothetical protein ACJAU9_001296 [Lentimonas sp.]